MIWAIKVIYRFIKRVLLTNKSKKLINNNIIKVPTNPNLDFGERFYISSQKSYREASLIGAILVKVGRLALRNGHRVVRTPLVRNFLWRRVYWTAGLTGILGILTYTTSYASVSQFLAVIYAAFKALFVPVASEVRESWLATVVFVAWKLTELTVAWVLIASIWNYPILKDVVINNWDELREGGITLVEFFTRNLWTMWGFVQIPTLQSLVSADNTIRSLIQRDPGLSGFLFGGWAVAFMMWVLIHYF